MGPAADVLPKALEQFIGEQLLDFARQLHLKRMQLSAAQTSSEWLSDAATSVRDFKLA